MSVSTLPNALNKSIMLPYSQRIVINRIIKSSTTEHLSDPTTNHPNRLHNNVYRIWSLSGVSIIHTGNVHIDRRYMESTRNIAAEQCDFDNTRVLLLWQQWAKAAKTNNNLAIVQLNHGGRQVPKSVNDQCIASSPIPL